jgi:predicted nuclease with TOPRIM domain
MSKNAEILAEIISEEISKLTKLVSEQSKITQEFSNTVEKASKIEIKTERLEEVIRHWNDLFTKQKQQIKELQKQQIKKNKIHRIITYILLIIIMLTLIFKII